MTAANPGVRVAGMARPRSAPSPNHDGQPRRPFGAVVRDLLIERGITTAIGNPNWSALAAQLDDIQYETLRKAVTADRWPSPKVMEAVAHALDVDPSTFWEYQLWLAQRAFDPREVGEEEALANLQRWLNK